MRLTVAAMLAVTLAGCGAAAERIPAGELGVSARDAYSEARTVAGSWSDDARLRWIDGRGINAEGVALGREAQWRFHYTAPGATRELLVRVLPLETTSEERPTESPPGYVIGDNALDPSWIDSKQAMAAVTAAAGRAVEPSSIMLIPTRPAQWVVRASDSDRRWRVHAETGEVLEP